MSELRESVDRLKKDIKAAAAIMTVDEARFLVDDYYMIQEQRKRASNQERAMGDEPNLVVGWLDRQSQTLESELKKALDTYSSAHPVGVWMKSIYGIGPVIAAGLLAHIDIKQAPTAGHIYRFAGLDPTVKWEKKTKRPWNGALKTLCWKVGQSFMKFSGSEECVYGKMYIERKAYEVARNESGGNAEIAAKTLAAKNWGKTTEAYKALIAGKLPPAQIDARARRWVVKIFLSHLQQVWWFQDTGTRAPAPYPVQHMGHVHIIPPPNTHLISGFEPY